MQFPGSALVHMLSDVRFTGFDLEGAAGEPWKLTMPFTAINHGGSINSSLAVPSYAFEDPFLFQSNPTYVIDGAAATGITGFKISHGVGVEELQSQAVTLDDIVVMNRDITLEITRRFESAALWQKIAWSSGIVPSINVATGAFRADSAYGSGGNARSISLQANLLNYEGADFGELDPDGKTVIETINAQVMKGATHALIALLSNAHASAYAP
jgi:hypothetical protein